MRWALLLVLSSTVAWAATPLQEALKLEAQGDDAAALKALDAIVRDQPTWELPRLEAARVRLKLGVDLDQPEADADIARSLAPENPRAQYLYGLVREERGDVEGALRAYELAVEYRPSYDEARFRLAGAYFAKQDWVNAEAQYRELARLHPDSLQARLQLAEVVERQGRTDAAEEELVRLWQQDKSPLAGRRLADFYERQGRPEMAQKIRAAMEPKRPKKKKMRPLKKSRR